MDQGSQQNYKDHPYVFFLHYQIKAAKNHANRNELTHTVEHPGSIVRGCHKQEDTDPEIRRIFPENQADTSHLENSKNGKIQPVIVSDEGFKKNCQRRKASVLAINKDGSYQLQAGIMKVNAKKDEVVLLEETQQQVKKIIERSKREFRNTPTATELDLRGMSADEAIATLSVFLDSAMLANLSSVRIIHGKGTGALRAAVQQSLKKNKFVKKFRLGVYGEGEDGVTIAEFR